MVNNASPVGLRSGGGLCELVIKLELGMSKLDGAGDWAKTGRSQCGGAEEGGSHFDRVVFLLLLLWNFFGLL